MGKEQKPKDRSWHKDEFARHEVLAQFWTFWFPLLSVACFFGVLIFNNIRLASKKSAVVIVYAAQDQVYAEPILREFEKETGIKVKAVYDSEAVKTVGLANRLLAERSHPQCDVFWGNEEMRDRKSTRLNSSHGGISRMPSSA